MRVSVFNDQDGQTTDLLFDQFPIRIGRNQLNDLVLNHPYVSQWHALLGCSAKGSGHCLSLVQVGTSNKTTIDHRQLAPQQEIELSGQESIRIRPFTLHLQLVQLPKELRRTPPGVEREEGPSDDRRATQALAGFERLSRRFLGRSLDSAKDVGDFTEQLEQSLDVFTRCFVALQKGQDQFREALDLSALGQKQSELERASDAAELSRLLLGRRSARRIDALERAFKNIMLHQVALLNGLMAGVRTLLQKLSPQSVVKEASRGRRAPNYRQLWQAYEQVHHDLAEEDNATFETIFGKQFGKAYTTLVDGSAPVRRRKRKPTELYDEDLSDPGIRSKQCR